MIKCKYLLISCVFASISSNAFVIDYDSINDDDNPNNFGTNTLNYAVEGYFHEDESQIHIHNDKQKGIMKNEKNSPDGGLVLEGVNKSDFESLYYGKELLKDTNKTK